MTYSRPETRAEGSGAARASEGRARDATRPSSARAVGASRRWNSARTRARDAAKTRRAEGEFPNDSVT